MLTSTYPVAACGSLGKPEGRSAFMKLPEKLPGHLKQPIFADFRLVSAHFEPFFQVLLADFDPRVVVRRGS